MLWTASTSHLLVGPNDGHGELSLSRAWLAPWSSSVDRCHDAEDDLVVVLRGRAEVRIEGDTPVALSPDEVIHIVRGRRYVVQALDAGHGEALEILILSTKAGH